MCDYVRHRSRIQLIPSSPLTYVDRFRNGSHTMLDQFLHNNSTPLVTVKPS
jgi:hypothetical protein